MTLLTTAFAQGTHAARPAAASSNAGFYYFETDTTTLFQSTGAAWVQLSPTVGHTVRSVVTITASATYTVPANVTALYVQAVGGGGAGGGTPVTNAGAPGTTAAAAGGRGGSYAASWLTSLAASYTVTIGAGGTGSAGAGGGNGTDTSFGAAVIAGAGKGAPVAVRDGGTFPDTSGSLGGPNNASTGDMTIIGGIAQTGYVFSATLPISGAGGPGSVFGTARVSGSAGGTFAGGNAAGYGSGGNGATAVANAAAQAGGNGNSGICVVTEYF